MGIHIQEFDKLDTFRVGFQPGDAGYPITFAWTNAAEWTSLRMVDPFGGILGVAVDMRSDSTVVITNDAITRVTIIGGVCADSGGKCLVSDVPSSDPLLAGNPKSFALDQNYPNPFNPATRISFALPERSSVSLEVFDLFGRMVADLFSGVLPPGRHEREWNAAGIASGVYYYRLTAAPVPGGPDVSFTQTKKLLLMR